MPNTKSVKALPLLAVGVLFAPACTLDPPASKVTDGSAATRCGNGVVAGASVQQGKRN